MSADDRAPPCPSAVAALSCLALALRRLAGWVVERYQIDLLAAAQHARAVMNQKMISLCAQAVPGDTHRNLSVKADYSGQTFKHILVPVWLLTYNYGPRAFQVVINGFTGAMAGRYPKSWVKIALAALAVLAALGFFLILAQRGVSQ